jgi:hypothetical protein
MSKRLRMRQDEAGLKITEDFVLSHNAAGEVLNEYRRIKPPLDMWRDDTKRKVAKAIRYHKDYKTIEYHEKYGLSDEKYQAGVEYGKLWRESKRERSPPHGDTTRIIVDGSGGAPDPVLPTYSRELHDAQRAVGDEETVTMLNRLCGEETWPEGEKRRFKRMCREGLALLAKFWD